MNVGTVKRLLPFFIACLLSSCMHARSERRGLTVLANQAADQSCTLTIDDRTFTAPRDDAELEALLKNYPDKRTPVIVEGRVDTPWRCIGGVIFKMQMLGFPAVHFTSQPEPRP